MVSHQVSANLTKLRKSEPIYHCNPRKLHEQFYSVVSLNSELDSIHVNFAFSPCLNWLTIIKYD